MGAYQPSYAVRIARSAVTRPKSVAADSNDVDTDAVANAGSVDSAAGVARKQPTTRTSSSTPIAALTTVVTELPSRRPIQWIPVKAARMAIATAREYASAGGHRTPRNATAVTEL